MERSRPISWPAGIEESILKQKKVSCTIPVHAEFRRMTHRREGTVLLDGVYKDTGCIVVAHWDKSTITSFDVYAGTGSNNAVSVLNRWIAQGNQKSKDSSAWAKTPAFNYTRWLQDELEQEAEDKMKEYLGPIPTLREGDPVRPKITVDWPEDLLNLEATPRTVFGNTLQALDDIRKRDEVWITQLPNHKIEIVGRDINNIDAAETHYKTLIARVLNEKCSPYHTTNLILDEREGINVALERAGDWWPACPDLVIPRLLPSPMMDQPGSYREDGLHDTQLIELRDSVKRAIDSVRHKKGSYDFVVRLGCIALDSKKVGEERIGRQVTKDSFHKDITDQVDLMPKKWLLNNALGVRLYRHLIAASDFLEPVKSADFWGTLPVSLEQSQPSFRGTWIFQNPSGPIKQPGPAPRNVGRSTPLQQLPHIGASINSPSSCIVVQVDWTDDGDGSYEKTGTRFYKLEPGRGGAKMNMEVRLLELGESRAWSFDLESMMPMTKSTVPPILRGFAEQVTLKPGYEVASTQSFAEWAKTPSIVRSLKGGRLDRIYSFGVKKTCYKVELSAMWYPNERAPCWGLAVRHSEWAMHLAELERLQTGHQASWGDTLTTFLPDQGDSSFVLDNDVDFGVGKLKLDSGVDELRQSPSREGIRTLTKILLQLSGIVSAVVEGGVAPLE